MEAVKKSEPRTPAAGAATNGAPRRPLAPSEKNNAASPAAVGRRTEGPSRFKPKPVAPPAPAPAPAAPAAARRCSSPSPGRAIAAADSGGGGSATCSGRARSADRARPAAAAPSPSPSRLKPPSAAAARSASAAVPPRDAAADARSSTPPRARNAKKATAGDLSASPARSSSPLLRRDPVVQSSPASKVDRLVQGLPSEQATKLRPAGAVPAAERKRSPRRASTNNTGGQCENARPSASPANSVAAKHWWPGMTMTGRGRGSASAGLSTSTSTCAARAEKASSRSVSSSDDASAGRSPKIVHRRRKDKADSSSDDASSQTSESSRSTCRCRPSKAISSPVPVLRRSLSSSSSSSARQGLLSAAPSSAYSRSCCQSPSRMRPSAPSSCQSKCASWAAQPVVEQPVFSYIVDDARKGKKSAGQIEDIHQLRLLSSRYLQWRFVNAHSEETMSRKNSVERVLYNVWKSVLTMRDALTITRTNVRQLQEEVKLYAILTEQIGYLEQWPVLEEECNDTLVEATEALKATTLRLPVTSGAHADEISVRNAISSAVDVMQALSSSIDYVQSKVEDRTSLVSELSVMARQEKVALDRCRELLATAAKLQVQETSLRTLLMQMRQRSAAG